MWFVSHIEGRNAEVVITKDLVYWVPRAGFSDRDKVRADHRRVAGLGQIGLEPHGAWHSTGTPGCPPLAIGITHVGMDSITSVRLRREEDGPYWLVVEEYGGGSVEMRCSVDEGEQAVAIISRLSSKCRIGSRRASAPARIK